MRKSIKKVADALKKGTKAKGSYALSKPKELAKIFRETIKQL